MKYLRNIGVNGNALLGGDTFYKLTKARHSLSSGAKALEDAIVAELDANLWTGFPDSQVWDVTTVCTTADEVRTATEAYKASGVGQSHKIVCNWDGVSEMTSTSLRGLTYLVLTANPSEKGGYDRPSGGVLITNADGRTPAIGNNGSGSVSAYGFPRLEINGVGFATRSGSTDWTVGGNTYALNVYTNSTYPLPMMLSVKNSNTGAKHWFPSEPWTSYCNVIKTQNALSVYLDNNDFYGVVSVLRGGAKYFKASRNFIHQCSDDNFNSFGFVDTEYWSIADTIYSVIEFNVSCDFIDHVDLSPLHQDFFQTGNSSDIVSGYNSVVRSNLWHMTAEFSGGSQGFYQDDYLTASNSMVCHGNIGTISAFWAAVAFDPSGLNDSYIEGNTLFRAGKTDPVNDSVTNVLISDIGGQFGANGGNAYVINNVLASITDNGFTGSLVSSGNMFVSPTKNRVSGDGLSQGTALRPEEFFIGTFNRDVNDFLTYSIPNEDSGDLQLVIEGFKKIFEPIGGWGSVGANVFEELIDIHWDGDDLTELNVDANADGFNIVDNLGQLEVVEL